MKIIVANKQERLLIESLCDIALKADGMTNYNSVTLILRSIKDEPVKEVKLPEDDKS